MNTTRGNAGQPNAWIGGRRIKAGVIILAGALIFLAPSARAQKNQDCLMCHGNASFSIERAGKRRSLVVDEATRSASVHGFLDCASCHSDAATVPHQRTPSRVDCAICHAEVAEKHSRSIHGKGGPADSPRANCTDCHGSHDIRKPADRESMVYAGRLPETCGQCHTTHSQSYLGSTHARGLLRSGLLISASCKDCHGSHEIQPNDNPTSRLFAAEVPNTCGTCHVGVLGAYRQSIHGQRWEKGEGSAPTCINCHASHTIKRVEDERFRLGVISQCGSCHGKEFETYRKSYHGQVTALGFALVAQCSDCHGSHNILPVSNQASLMSITNRTDTCKRCHPSANQNFAGFDPHADPTDKRRSPLLYYVNSFMIVLLVGVFAFFGAHTLLWSLRSAIERRRVRKTEEEKGDETGEEHGT